ncbi:UNVERIFIED_CONTAM: hypothetical protein GTU68_010494 [Idotea baltica]|nr:hypothetical protein [Idotea baltica]
MGLSLMGQLTELKHRDRHFNLPKH